MNRRTRPPWRWLAIALALAVVIPAATAADDNPAAKPEQRKDAGAMKRHENFLKRAREGNVDVLFLGDSITQGWEGNGKEAWKKSFEPLKAANFGIGGDRTQHVLWRITEGKELEGISPKVVVLMIGTNNVGGNTAEQIAGGVEAIVKELRKQKPDAKVLLLGVFPRAGNASKDKTEVPAGDLQPKIKQINERIAKLNDDKNVRYLDIGGKFLDKDGALPRAIMPDFLHLSAKGYDIWAEAIEGQVKEMMK